MMIIGVEFLYDKDDNEKTVHILFSNDYISQECNKLGDIWGIVDFDNLASIIPKHFCDK